MGVTICEDLWFPEPGAQAKAAGAELLVSINASPYHRNKLAERYAVMGALFVAARWITEPGEGHG